MMEYIYICIYQEATLHFNTQNKYIIESSIYESNYLPTYLPAYLPAYLPTCLPTYLPILSIYLTIQTETRWIL